MRLDVKTKELKCESNNHDVQFNSIQNNLPNLRVNRIELIIYQDKSTRLKIWNNNT